jgi:hypothetical protein
MSKGHHYYLDKLKKFSIIGSYPHRNHHKNKGLSKSMSAIKARKESDRINDLEKEVKELKYDK